MKPGWIRKLLTAALFIMLCMSAAIVAFAQANVNTQGNTCSPTNTKPSCKECPPPRGNPSPGTPKSNPPCP
jgi:hypothetical protein